MKLKHFAQSQIKSNVAEVRKKWGLMWSMVGPEVQNAFIEQHVLTMMLTVSIGRPTIDKAVLHECLTAMRLEAGLLIEDDV